MHTNKSIEGAEWHYDEESWESLLNEIDQIYTGNYPTVKRRFPKNRKPISYATSWGDGYDYDSSSSCFNSKYYNDNLDMDQQSPEFWDSL